MKQTTSSSIAAAILSTFLVCGSAFTFMTSSPNTISSKTSSSLNMGLFDGVKEAFNAPPGDISAERETPIDRWMGWSARNGSGVGVSVGVASSSPSDDASGSSFIDAMNPVNYVTVSLEKPMGIVFEENDKPDFGIFVTELKEDGAAEKNGQIQLGDQLIAVNGRKVYGKEFDDALGVIIDSELPLTELLFFRGPAKQFYGKTGASEEWLEEFVGEKKYQN